MHNLCWTLLRAAKGRPSAISAGIVGKKALSKKIYATALYDNWGKVSSSHNKRYTLRRLRRLGVPVG